LFKVDKILSSSPKNSINYARKIPRRAEANKPRYKYDDINPAAFRQGQDLSAREIIYGNRNYGVTDNGRERGKIRVIIKRLSEAKSKEVICGPRRSAGGAMHVKRFIVNARKKRVFGGIRYHHERYRPRKRKQGGDCRRPLYKRFASQFHFLKI